ncbi:GL10559 [Drosophila persimilis]|uniref:GL10559 n=1 Tax=Drosophila persimilis TaxID=7234 RepID=B4GBA0_DROPE|nr:defensin [Drosophila persimilis]EDW32202.1 GL10559 [Drosophila persimilis]
MKFIVFLALSLAVMCLVQAQPLAEEPIEEDVAKPLVQLMEQPVQDVDVPEHSRQKRATCDLLSKWNVKHTACAGHCLAKGFKGGYCNNKAVCICRR